MTSSSAASPWIGWCVQNVMSELCFNRRTRFLIGPRVHCESMIFPTLCETNAISIALISLPFSLFLNSVSVTLSFGMYYSMSALVLVCLCEANRTPYSISNYKLRYHVIAAHVLLLLQAYFYSVQYFLSLIVEMRFFKFILFVWPACVASVQCIYLSRCFRSSIHFSFSFHLWLCVRSTKVHSGTVCTISAAKAKQ